MHMIFAKLFGILGIFVFCAILKYVISLQIMDTATVTFDKWQMLVEAVAAAQEWAGSCAPLTLTDDNLIIV